MLAGCPYYRTCQDRQGFIPFPLGGELWIWKPTMWRVYVTGQWRGMFYSTPYQPFLHHLRSGNMQIVRFSQIDLRDHDRNNNLTKTSYPTINCPAASHWSAIICTHNAEAAAGRGFWSQGIFQGGFYRTCFFISSTLLAHESCPRCRWALLLQSLIPKPSSHLYSLVIGVQVCIDVHPRRSSTLVKIIWWRLVWFWSTLLGLV